MKPSRKRELATELESKFGVSERRACRVIELSRSTHRYESVKDDQAPLRSRIKDIAQSRIRYGYRRIHILLEREGWKINHKRVYRLYAEEQLSLRFKRPKRHVSAVHRLPREGVGALNEVWGMDFVSDELTNGRRIRVLPVLDLFSRECLALFLNHNIRGADVVAVLDALIAQRGAPGKLRCDNGPEFVSKVLDKWAYEHGVQLDFSRRGKPTDNAFVESFNGRFREECLNAHWFWSLEDAREKTREWMEEYNQRRPHYALGFQTPFEFAAAVRFSGTQNPMNEPDFPI